MTFFKRVKLITVFSVFSSLIFAGGVFAEEISSPVLISAAPDAKTILSQGIDKTFSSKFNYYVNFKFNRAGTLSKDLDSSFNLKDLSFVASGYADFSDANKLNLTYSTSSCNYRVNTGERVYLTLDGKIVNNDFYTKFTVAANPKKYVSQDIRSLAGKWLQPKQGDGVYDLVSNVITLNQVSDMYHGAKEGEAAFLDSIDAKIVKKEKIDGVESYLVNITFDKEKSKSLFQGNVSGYNLLLADSSFKVWIGVNDSVIRKATFSSSKWTGKEKDTLSINYSAKNIGKVSEVKAPVTVYKGK
jgi:hypothetical protein